MSACPAACSGEQRRYKGPAAGLNSIVAAPSTAAAVDSTPHPNTHTHLQGVRAVGQPRAAGTAAQRPQSLQHLALRPQPLVHCGGERLAGAGRLVGC